MKIGEPEIENYHLFARKTRIFDLISINEGLKGTAVNRTCQSTNGC